MCCSAQVCQQNWPPSCTMLRSVIRAYRSEAKVNRGAALSRAQGCTKSVAAVREPPRASTGQVALGATVLHCYSASELVYCGPWTLRPRPATLSHAPASAGLCPDRATKDHNHTSTQDAGIIWKLNCYYNAFLIQDT